MLLSASKISKAGYKCELDNDKPFIINPKTKERIELKHRNGIFTMDLWFDIEKWGRVFSRPGR